MRKYSQILLSVLLVASCGPKDGIHTFHLLTTNDVHGAWFDSTYVGGTTRNSLFAVNYYVDSIRTVDGVDNVLLLDAGDCLQGDNAAYYYNYVDTQTEHLFPRLVSYMKYDAVTVGNHDIETGQPVYDRVRKDLKRHGIPFLAGNAIRNDNGNPYFQVYKTFKRAGLKVLVLGYTNQMNASWVDESIYSGMHFESLIPIVQEDVDRYSLKEKPQVVIVSVHSATGLGDGRSGEAQGLDLYNSLHGVDFLVCSHDHRQTVFCNDSIALINTGNRAKYLGHGVISVDVVKGKAVSRKLKASLIKVDKRKADPVMRDAFRKDYQTVKDFSFREIGVLTMDLRTRDAYSGMCDYVNLLHSVQLNSSKAQLSFAAPLTFNGIIKAGTLVYNDLFTLYPFENQLFVMKMKGSEIKNYMEFCYSRWLSDPGSNHVLRIVRRDDPRNNQAGWSFVYRSYNFDSVGGLVYTVDITKPTGERVEIKSMADGTPFDLEADYSVAMTSYRASGAGGMLTEGAGIPMNELDSRITGKYEEIREFLYRYIEEYGLIDHDTVSDPGLIGSWKFIPETVVNGMMESDYRLLF